MILGSKRLLIVGGTSSLAHTLIGVAKHESYEITATVRGNLGNFEDSQTKWINLNLSNKYSIENFLVDLSDTQFDRVIFLIGATTNKEFLEISYDEILQYYTTYAVNSLYLLQKSLPYLKDTANILVMSSRSGSKPSYDVHYSAVKSALEAFVRSSAKKLAKNQSIVAISSGLIKGSRMYLDMKPEHRILHEVRAGGSLITLEEICAQIWCLNPKETIENSGQTIHLGPIY